MSTSHYRFLKITVTLMGKMTDCELDPVCKCMSKIPADWDLERCPVNEGDSK